MDLFEMNKDSVQLYLDSADPAEWERFLPTGTLLGVTTNPLLLERASQPCTLENLETLTRRAVKLGCESIHLQTWGPTIEAAVHHGSQLALMSGLGISVYVKVPCTEDGFKVAKMLTESSCRITLTGVFNPAQVILAAGFGARYAAPYLGRITDAGGDGMQALQTMQQILTRSQSDTRLLAASIRSVDQVVELATAGLNTFTLRAQVLDQLFTDRNTDEAAIDFQRASQWNEEN